MTKLSHGSLIAKSYMDIDNKNELHTLQGMDSRQMPKSQLSIEILYSVLKLLPMIDVHAMLTKHT